MSLYSTLMEIVRLIHILLLYMKEMQRNTLTKNLEQAKFISCKASFVESYPCAFGAEKPFSNKNLRNLSLLHKISTD